MSKIMHTRTDSDKIIAFLLLRETFLLSESSAASIIAFIHVGNTVKFFYTKYFFLLRFLERTADAPPVPRMEYGSQLCERKTRPRRRREFINVVASGTCSARRWLLSSNQPPEAKSFTTRARASGSLLGTGDSTACRETAVFRIPGK